MFVGKYVNAQHVRVGAFVMISSLLLWYQGGVDRQAVLSLHTPTPPTRELPIVFPTPFPYPKVVRESAPPVLTAQAATVIDVTTAAVLFEYNAQERLKPASTTKIMTALVALERCSLGKVATVKTLDLDDTNTQMGLVAGEQLTVEALLYGLLLNSGNDAAIALAENCGERIAQFVELMNLKAIDLHLASTHFTNPSGLDHPDHYTSAQDLARLTAVAMRDPVFAGIVGTKEITVSNGEKTRWHTLINKNALLGASPNVVGVKTGWTQAAGECLVIALKHEEHTIVSVVLGSRDRFGDSKALIEWVLERYSWRPVSS